LEVLNIFAKNAAEKSALQNISGTDVEDGEITVEKENEDEI